MSIGATLAAARRHAGLSVGQVSQRTRVRENIIEGIEHDDYAACGGDFYARGHIRAIAGAVGADPVPLVEEFDERWRSSPEITAAQVFQPSMPLRTRERRRVRWAGILAVAVLAVLGFAVYKFVAGAGGTPRPGAAAGQHQLHGGRPASGAAGAPAAQASTRRASPASAPSAAPTASQALTPARVTAFGPGGGDDPQNAALAVSGNPATPWQSDWYATSYFGNLYAGTGLLLDMGRAVTISSVRVSLGGSPGADFQLRAGSAPVLDDLRTVAAATGAGGAVQLSLAPPANARYLVIWFTKLPPDASGTYQVSVYGIHVQGRP